MDKAFAGIRNCRVKILKFLVEISRWKMKNYVSDNGFCIIILNFEKDVLENDIRKWIKFVNVKNERKSYVGKALHTMFGLRPWGGKNWFKIALTGIVWRIALVGIVLKLVIAKRRLFWNFESKILDWLQKKKIIFFWFLECNYSILLINGCMFLAYNHINVSFCTSVHAVKKDF
jgi:hypothetical protein